MFERLLIEFANYLEKKSRKIKKEIQRKRKEWFVNKFELTELKRSEKKDLRFNPYEGTNLFLVDELIKEKIINKDDKIIDIGCGTGIFMLYWSYLGFDNLLGIEYDKELYDICVNNISKYKIKCDRKIHVSVYNENALDFNYSNDSTCFYLFNTFYDQNTYIKWIENIEENIRNNPRKVKIIILYPTVASLGAMRTRKWLKEKKRVLCKAQYCYNCMHFVVYEGGENIENIDDFNC